MTTYKNRRPESPKGQIFHRYSSNGEDTALKYGLEIGIDEKRIRRWFKQWGDPNITPSPVKQDAPSFGKRKRVFNESRPDVHGTVITEGEQVSEIKWDNPEPWGAKCFVSNEQLRPVGALDDSIPSNEVKAIFLGAAQFVVMDGNRDLDRYPTFEKAKKKANSKYQIFAVTKAGRSHILMRSIWDWCSKQAETERQTNIGSKRRLSNKEIDEIVEPPKSAVKKKKVA